MRKITLMILFIFGCLCLNNVNAYSEIQQPMKIPLITTPKETSSQEVLHSKKYFHRLENHIHDYIDSVAPKSKLKARAIISSCEKYNVDICFVMAQGQLESHFGTTGLAKRTNSVWNVIGNGYSDPNSSIEPYLELLTNKYLVNKSEHDLMRRYVSIHGKRYAQASNYESKLKAIYTYIKYHTKIDNLYWKYLKSKKNENSKS